MRAVSTPTAMLLGGMALGTAGLAVGTAAAHTPSGVSFPATKTVNGVTLQLDGTGTRTVSYFIDAYASAL